jgi:hypothetical protein
VVFIIGGGTMERKYWTWDRAILFLVDKRTKEYQKQEILRTEDTDAISGLERVWEYEIPEMMKHDLPYFDEMKRLIMQGHVVLMIKN